MSTYTRLSRLTKEQRRRVRWIYATITNRLRSVQSMLATELAKADDPAVLEAVLRKAERRRKWRTVWTWVFHIFVIYVSFRLWYVGRQNESLRSDLAACRQSMQRTDALLDSQSQKMDSLRRDHALRDSLFQRATGTGFTPLVRAMEYTGRQAGRAQR